MKREIPEVKRGVERKIVITVLSKALVIPMFQIYNTRSRQKEAFEPMGDPVKMFVCGPTVYDHSHLGHARTYVFYDVLCRYLRHLGYRVFYIQNVTDVGHLFETGEDKILKKAAAEKKPPMEIADYYLAQHLEVMDALHIERPNIMPRATGHVVEIIEQIKTLIQKGYAYEVNGSVYFEIDKFSDYGKLSRRKIEQLVPGARVAVKGEKKDPRDFALWIKASEGHIMRWPSPWGVGYPGWHIEDTAIALKYFGPQYDIHGGAIELVFPHHEAEIAQAEGTTGIKPYVRYWVHSGLLTIQGEKMAKSLGNFITVREALSKHSPEALRLWMARTHYRKPLDYNEHDLEDAEKNVQELADVIQMIDERLKTKERGKGNAFRIKELKRGFWEAIEDDLNTPLALASFFNLLSEVRGNCDRYSEEALVGARRTIMEMGELLQIIPPDVDPLVGALAGMIVELRNDLRKEKEWGRADELRKRLKDVGVVLEDRPEGTRWRVERG